MYTYLFEYLTRLGMVDLWYVVASSREEAIDAFYASNPATGGRIMRITPFL